MDSEQRIAELEKRIAQLEEAEEPDELSRRDAMKLGGAGLAGALMGGGGSMAAVDRASAGTDQSGTIGTAADPVDVIAEDIDSETVTTERINGTRFANQYSSLQNAADDTPFGGTLVIPTGTIDDNFSISKPINVTGRAAYDGEFFTDTGATPEGSVITNSQDVPAIEMAPASRKIGATIIGIMIEHTGNSPGIVIDNITHSKILFNLINMGDSGNRGVEYRNDAFFTDILFSYIGRFTDRGVYIQGNGSEHSVRYSQVTSSTTGAVPIYTEQPGTKVKGGQYNTNGDGSEPGVKFHNPRSSSVQSGKVEDITVEVGVGVEIDGDTNSFDRVRVSGIRANLDGIGNSLVKFGDTTESQLEYPQTTNTGGASDLAEFTTDSKRSGIIAREADVAGSSITNNGVESWLYIPQLINDAYLSGIPTATDVAIQGVTDYQNAPVVYDESAGQWLEYSSAATTFTP